MIRNRARAVAVWITAFALPVIMAALMVGRKPVLLRVHGTVEQQHPLYILNPFRDRAPERVAEGVLKQVSDGHCQAVAISLMGKPDPKCDQDTELRVISWRMRAREDKRPDDVLLLFQVTRDFGPRGKDVDPYWFEVHRFPDGSWRVITLDRWF